VNTICFFVTGHARTKGRICSFVNPKTRRIVSKESDPRSKAWAQLIGIHARAQWRTDPAPLRFAVKLDAIFHFLRPGKHFAANGDLRPDAQAYPIGRGHYGDTDKLQRNVMDALTGVVYEDDSQVVEQRASKQFGEVEGVFIRVLVFDPTTEN
jgi:Holliday junction resolvase RusA-like endonuclease